MMGAFAEAVEAFGDHGIAVVPTLPSQPSKPMVKRPEAFGVPQHGGNLSTGGGRDVHANKPLLLSPNANHCREHAPGYHLSRPGNRDSMRHNDGNTALWATAGPRAHRGIDQVGSRKRPAPREAVVGSQCFS